jgi:hypothetical protein
MKIQVRYIGTTKTPVVNYEVYADGLRIGSVKMSGTDWRAVNWRHSHIGEYLNRRDATAAVVVAYKIFRKKASSRNLKAFKEHAIRL